jgi:hypothetical protein
MMRVKTFLIVVTYSRTEIRLCQLLSDKFLRSIISVQIANKVGN